jgi:hypothetical protein
MPMRHSLLNPVKAGEVLFGLLALGTPINLLMFASYIDYDGKRQKAELKSAQRAAKARGE